MQAPHQNCVGFYLQLQNMATLGKAFCNASSTVKEKVQLVSLIGENVTSFHMPMLFILDYLCKQHFRRPTLKRFTFEDQPYRPWSFKYLMPVQ